MTDQKFEKVEMSSKELQFAKDRDSLAVLNSQAANITRAQIDCVSADTGASQNRLKELADEKKVVLSKIKEISDRISFAPIMNMISEFGKPAFSFLLEHVALSDKKGYRTLKYRTEGDTTISLRLIVNVKGTPEAEADVVTPDQGPIAV